MAFCSNCGAQVGEGDTFCSKCGAKVVPATPQPAVSPTADIPSTAQATEETISPKSRLATTLLAFFLGGFGAHRFYTGKIGTAVAMLVLFIVGLATVWIIVGVILIVAVWIWAFVDFIMAVAGVAKDKEGRTIKNW